MSVNIAVLLFLGYAVLGPRGPLRTAVQGYFAERDARSAAADALRQLASNEASPTLIEFTDFQCPYCREMHDVLKQGVTEGKFELVTMHFPLDRIHPLARPAAKASLCADGAGQSSRDEQPSDVHERVDGRARLGTARARRASRRGTASKGTVRPQKTSRVRLANRRGSGLPIAQAQVITEDPILNDTAVT